MKHNLKKIFLSILLAVFLLNIAGMPKTQQLNHVNAASVSGKVSSGILNIRAGKSTAAKKLTTVKKGKAITILEAGGKWVKVSVNGVVGYTQGKYIKTSYGTASNLYSNSVSGQSNAALNIHSGNSASTPVIGKIKKGSKVQVLSTGTQWVKVKVGNVIGYTKGSSIKTQYGTASNNGSKGSSVVAYAKRFLGNPYVYGGSSLTRGTDCSGFVMSVYRHFGKSLPHSSYALRSVGKRVSGGVKNARPGDIICYSGHVAIYMGNNRVIHASNPKSGIKITNNASYRKIVCIRRIF